MNNNIVNIHGKDYMTVAGRVQEAHKDGLLVKVNTEILQHTPNVVVKATVTIKDGDGFKQFTGISASNPNKAIEKSSPYEVAETSAVGRALGFAGFGSTESIATADEMIKSEEAVATSDITPYQIKRISEEGMDLMTELYPSRMVKDLNSDEAAVIVKKLDAKK